MIELVCKRRGRVTSAQCDKCFKAGRGSKWAVRRAQCVKDNEKKGKEK